MCNIFSNQKSVLSLLHLLKDLEGKMLKCIMEIQNIVKYLASCNYTLINIKTNVKIIGIMLQCFLFKKYSYHTKLRPISSV